MTQNGDEMAIPSQIQTTPKRRVASKKLVKARVIYKSRLFVDRPIPLISSTREPYSTKKMSPTIQNPAPAFSVTALVDGGFKQVSLSDYLGQWYTRLFFSPSSSCAVF
jgi:hypothetical protein